MVSLYVHRTSLALNEHRVGRLSGRFHTWRDTATVATAKRGDAGRKLATLAEIDDACELNGCYKLIITKGLHRSHIGEVCT